MKCGHFGLYSLYPRPFQAPRLPLVPRELMPCDDLELGIWLTAVRHPNDDVHFNELMPARCDFHKALACPEKVIVLTQRTFQNVEFWTYDETPNLCGTCEKITEELCFKATRSCIKSFFALEWTLLIPV